MDAALFGRIRAMQDRFDALCERIAKGYENVPEDAGMAEIERASALARQETADELAQRRPIAAAHASAQDRVKPA